MTFDEAAQVESMKAQEFSFSQMGAYGTEQSAGNCQQFGVGLEHGGFGVEGVGHRHTQ